VSAAPAAGDAGRASGPAGGAPARDGWARRATCSAERLYEQVLLYNELGYEVRVEAADPVESSGGCTACARPESPERVLFIRRPE
jgi:hypothetical protein